MSIIVEDREFDGPFTSAQSVETRSGVFVVFDYDTEAGYHRLDVGESDNVHAQLLDHDRIHCWEQHSQGALAYAVYYADEATRELVAPTIRACSDLPCGGTGDKP